MDKQTGAYCRKVMGDITHRICGFWRNQSGATAVENGLLAAYISIAVILGAEVVGSELTSTFSLIDYKLSQAQQWTPYQYREAYGR